MTEGFRSVYSIGIIIFGLLLGMSPFLYSRKEYFPIKEKTSLRIALTFDDGPHKNYTEKILNILRENKTSATFFVVGKQAIQHPKIIQEMAKQGHEVANHTYDHPNLIKLSKKEIMSELKKTKGVIKKWALQKKQNLFRPPGGRYDSKVLESVHDQGYTMVLWTVLPKDHEIPTKKQIYDRVMNTAKDGGIILLHSGVEPTIAVLSDIIQDLKERGFNFYTVSELIEEDLDQEVKKTWWFPPESKSQI